MKTLRGVKSRPGPGNWFGSLFGFVEISELEISGEGDDLELFQLVVVDLAGRSVEQGYALLFLGNAMTSLMVSLLSRMAQSLSTPIAIPP